MIIYVKFKTGLAPAGFQEGVEYQILNFNPNAEEILLGDKESGVFEFVDIGSCLLVGYKFSGRSIIIEIQEGKAPEGFEAGKQYPVLVTDISEKRFVLADTETKAINFILIKDCIRKG